MTEQAGTAIVVGGGLGVGRAAVVALAAAGRRVWAVGRNRARLDGASREALGPGEVLTRAFDATDGPTLDRLIDEVDPARADSRLSLCPLHRRRGGAGARGLPPARRCFAR